MLTLYLSACVFHIQYSTEVAHNLKVDGTPDDMFSLFEKITALMRQKKKVQQLVDGLEDPPIEWLATAVILDNTFSSSCKWVSYSNRCTLLL